MKEIEANTKKLTKEYLKYEAIKALSSNTKVKNSKYKIKLKIVLLRRKHSKILYHKLRYPSFKFALNVKINRKQEETVRNWELIILRFSLYIE
jgi:hypothetical protein